MILAPLRGVTIRCFREVFADVIREAGFTEAITPFIAANPGYDPLKDRELQTSKLPNLQTSKPLVVTPQFIGKDPAALRSCLERIKAAGYATADLNCGCPYPMVRSKGRGSGLLKTPAVLEKMIAVGCEVMGEGNFSIKARLGVERSDELLSLMPMINAYPLRFLTVHARTARQMYSGKCDWDAFDRIAAAAKVPLVRNGDLSMPGDVAACSHCTPSDPRGIFPIVRRVTHEAFPHCTPSDSRGFPDLPVMIGRSFIVALGERDDIGALLRRYIAASAAELSGDASVLGRLKELIAYWKFLPAWHRRWNVVKICRSVDELLGFMI